jgi:predicted transcriptional regulator
MIGINVRNTDVAFADLIVDGVKTIETRDSKSLHPYIGKTVAIVRTGQGKACAIGQVTITAVILVESPSEFDVAYNQHLVAKGSAFYIKDAKYMYHLTNAVRYATPKPVGFGIVSRKVL